MSRERHPHCVQAFWGSTPNDRLLRRSFTWPVYDRGGGSRNYVHTKKMMYSEPAAWDELIGQTRCRNQRVRGRASFGRAQIPFRSSTAGWVVSASRTTGATAFSCDHLVKKLQKNWRAGHLFRHRQRDSVGVDEGEPARKWLASIGVFL